MKQDFSKDFENRHEGYSDWEVDNIVSGSFRLFSDVHVRKRIPEVVLEQIPIVVLVRFYLEKIDIAGGLNLRETYEKVEDIESAIDQHPAAREIDFHSNRINPALEFDMELSSIIQFFCNESKLTKVVKGKMFLSRKGRSLLKNGNKLLKMLLLFFTYNTFSGEWDEFGETTTGQFGIGYSLILLNKYGDEKRSDSFYADKYFQAFPNLIESDIFNLKGIKLQDHYTMIYRYRFFNFFCRFFNLIEKYDAGKWKKRYVEKSEIFAELFYFIPPAMERRLNKRLGSASGQRKMAKRIFEDFDELENRDWKSKEELQSYLDSLIGKPLPKRRKSKKVSIDQEVESLILEAELCESAEQGIKLLKQAEEKGKAYIGKQFDEFIGHFWSVNPTRPYMRALMAHAEFLQKWKDEPAAINIMQRMLELDPDDHMMVRNKLGILLLSNRLYEKYSELRAVNSDENTTLWLYTDIFYNFLTTGKNKQAIAAVKKAVKENRFLADYIIKNKKLPAEIPESCISGDRNEAIICLRELMPIAAKTEGIREFLKEQITK